MNKIILYLTYGYPSREKFFEILDIIDKFNIYGVEIGIPSENPYLDGSLIKEISKKYLLNEDTILKFKEDIKWIYNNYKFKKYLMGYKNEVEKYNINSLSKYYDGIIIVDSKNNQKQIFLVNPDEDISIEKIKDIKSDFIYLISGVGKTGSFNKLPNQYIKNLNKIKENTSIPCFIGFGIQSKKDIEEVVNNGADGAVIGSKFLSIAHNKEDVEKFLKSLI